MPRHAVRVGQGRRLVIPAQLREKLGVKLGDTIWMEEKEGEVRITSLRQAILEAQRLVSEHVPAERDLVDELITERRLEAARE